MTDLAECPDVRLAVTEDLPGVMDLMRVACAEDAQHTMDEEKVLTVIMRHFDKQGVMLAVIGDVGDPVAYVISEVCPLWYSQEWQLLELSLFVHPEHRRSTYAKQLMRFMRAASEGLRLDLTIGVFSHKKTEAKIRLYQRQFPQVGAFFCYRPSAVSEDAR